MEFFGFEVEPGHYFNGEKELIYDILGGKKLTLLFWGLGVWNLHQMAIFAIRSKNQLQIHFLGPLTPNPPRR